MWSCNGPSSGLIPHFKCDWGRQLTKQTGLAVSLFLTANSVQPSLKPMRESQSQHMFYMQKDAGCVCNHVNDVHDISAAHPMEWPLSGNCWLLCY